MRFGVVALWYSQNNVISNFLIARKCAWTIWRRHLISHLGKFRLAFKALARRAVDMSISKQKLFFQERLHRMFHVSQDEVRGSLRRPLRLWNRRPTFLLALSLERSPAYLHVRCLRPDVNPSLHQNAALSKLRKGLRRTKRELATVRVPPLRRPPVLARLATWLRLAGNTSKAISGSCHTTAVQSLSFVVCLRKWWKVFQTRCASPSQQQRTNRHSKLLKKTWMRGKVRAQVVSLADNRRWPNAKISLRSVRGARFQEQTPELALGHVRFIAGWDGLCRNLVNRPHHRPLMRTARQMRKPGRLAESTSSTNSEGLCRKSLFQLRLMERNLLQTARKKIIG